MFPVHRSLSGVSAEENKTLGTLIMIEGISTEKRMKSTMSRYMDPGLADQLLGDGGGGDLMGGQDTVATLLIKQPDVWTFGFMPLSHLGIPI